MSIGTLFQLIRNTIPYKMEQHSSLVGTAFQLSDNTTSIHKAWLQSWFSAWQWLFRPTFIVYL